MGWLCDGYEPSLFFSVSSMPPTVNMRILPTHPHSHTRRERPCAAFSLGICGGTNGSVISRAQCEW